MERREFMGAMAALFGGVVLPGPVLECIRLIEPVEWNHIRVVPQSEIDAILKQVYLQPIIDGTFNDMRGFMDEVLGTALDGVKCYGKTHYFEVAQR